MYCRYCSVPPTLNIFSLFSTVGLKIPKNTVNNEFKLLELQIARTGTILMVKILMQPRIVNREGQTDNPRVEKYSFTWTTKGVQC